MESEIDPSAVKDYLFDWSRRLKPGETIVSHTVVATDGLTVASSQHTDTGVVVWLSDGVLGAVVDVTCHVTTSAGEQDDQTFTLQVVEK